MSLFGDILPINKNEEKNNQASANLSPYLNFDPHYIPKMQPEFLYPDDRHMASTARRSNVALPIIGMSFMTGSGRASYDENDNLKVVIILHNTVQALQPITNLINYGLNHYVRVKEQPSFITNMRSYLTNIFCT